MGRHENDNGMRGDFRYREQQSFINSVAKSIGCVAFRPNYHGKVRDGNTVLLYFREDAEHNRQVDAFTDRGYSRGEAADWHITDERYIYRDYFWSFENTDLNGWLSLDFANHGRIDLRGLDWQKRLRGSIMLAYYNKLQIKYVAACGGWYGVKEADETYNDLNTKRLDAYRDAHGKCFTGSINGWKKTDPIYTEYTEGKRVNCFDCDFAVKQEDDKLRELIESWRGDERLPKLGKDAEKITSRIEEIGGELFTWY